MTDEDRLWLPLEVRERGPAWQEALQAIIRAERENRPYLLDLEWPGPLRDLGGSLVESNSRVLEMLVTDLPSMSFVAGIRSRLGKTSAEPTLTLKLRDTSDLMLVPAGTLLVDLQHPASADEDRARAVREAFASNVMARPEAEYALDVELHAQSGKVRGLELLYAIAVAGEAASALPAESGTESNLVELSLRLGHEEPTLPGAVRIRIWRLGFMKIPSRSRFA